MNKKTDNKGKNKLIIILVAIIVCLMVIIGVLFVFKNDDKNNPAESIKTNENSSNKYKYSFNTMDVTDETLDESQKNLARFFDKNFFVLPSYDEIVRYADAIKNIKVATYCQVKAFISTDDDSYEVVCNWGMSNDYFWGDYELDLRNPILIKGKKPEPMFTINDTLTLKGKLVGAETRTIEGKNYYLPVMEVVEAGDGYNWYTEETIRTAAKLIFGDNVKVRRPTYDESQLMVSNYYYSYHDIIWLVEFENQSNLNFKVFDIWQSTPTGFVSYNALYNQGIESDYVNKQLYVTPDLQKYIVFDMSRIDKYVYISVYDRNLNKLWTREISNVSGIVWDATNTQLIFVSDNDLYNIDMESGKDIDAPLFVGKKISATIVENGYILISESSDDTVMFVDRKGKIKNKFDISISSSDMGNKYTSVQKLNDNYVILYEYVEVNGTINVISKYIILDKDGNLIKETK